MVSNIKQVYDKLLLKALISPDKCQESYIYIQNQDIVFDKSKRKKKLSRYRYIPSYIGEVRITSWLLSVKISTRSLAPARNSAYACRPPEYAFLLMRACTCASICVWKCWHTIYFLDLLDILYLSILNFAFSDNFDFFHFCFYFQPKIWRLQNSWNLLICNTNCATSDFYTLEKKSSCFWAILRL